MLSIRHLLGRHLPTSRCLLASPSAPKSTNAGGNNATTEHHDDESPSSSSASIVKKLLHDAATFEELRQDSATAAATPDTDWATLPYPDGTHFHRDQARKSHRAKVDPRETTIILFPGQGAQYVGMAAGLAKFPGARDIFEMASAVLK